MRGPGTGPMGRTQAPDPKWLGAVQQARENDLEHISADKLLALCWSEGFGAVATARLLDWWTSCHPDNINAQRRAAP